MSAPRLAVIMAGGSGERFWPLSTPQRPKQLLRLSSPDETMLEQAVRRIEPLVGPDGTYVATTPGLRGPVLESAVVADSSVLTEPAKRNTLGALVWAVANLLTHGEDASVAVLTADHMIGDAEAFRKTVADALALAESTGGLVTLGITPTRPETGYGYIEFDRSTVADLDGREVGFRAVRFREKPGLSQAMEFLEAGNFAWNSGMFFFTVGGFLRELAQADPEAERIAREVAAALAAGDAAAAQAAFERLPNLSIDYALLEKAHVLHVLPASFAWDDLGAWDSLERSLPIDGQGNVVQGDALLIDCQGSIVLNDHAPIQTCLLGVEDMVVVVTPHAVLVCPKERAQEVKRIVAALAERAR